MVIQMNPFEHVIKVKGHFQVGGCIEQFHGPLVPGHLVANRIVTENSQPCAIYGQLQALLIFPQLLFIALSNGDICARLRPSAASSSDEPASSATATAAAAFSAL